MGRRVQDNYFALSFLSHRANLLPPASSQLSNGISNQTTLAAGFFLEVLISGLSCCVSSSFRIDKMSWQVVLGHFSEDF
jgi:hypothetical protein